MSHLLFTFTKRFASFAASKTFTRNSSTLNQKVNDVGKKICERFMHLWRVTRFPMCGAGVGYGFWLANHESLELENDDLREFLFWMHAYPLMYGGLGFIWPVPLFYGSMLKLNQLYRFAFQHRLLIVPKQHPSIFRSSDG